MAPPKTKLTDAVVRYQGEVRPLTIAFEVNGSPLDLSNYVFTVSIAKSPTSVVLYKNLTTIVDGSSGLVSLNVPAIATHFSPGTYCLEVRYLTPGGLDQVVAELPLTLKPSLAPA